MAPASSVSHLEKGCMTQRNVKDFFTLRSMSDGELVERLNDVLHKGRFTMSKETLNAVDELDLSVSALRGLGALIGSHAEAEKHIDDDVHLLINDVVGRVDRASKAVCDLRAGFQVGEVVK